MNVISARLGFANNSSSTHSICFFGSDSGTMYDNETQFEYGWDDFTLVSNEAKARYMATALYHNIRYQIGPIMARIIAETLLLNGEFPDDGVSIDHQSHIMLPLSYAEYNDYRDGATPYDYDFFKALSDYIIDNDSIVILGGNDNSDGHPLRSRAEAELDVPTDGSHVLLSKYDEEYGFWTVFNPSNGSKVRFTFGKTTEPITRSSSPELMDIKITDYCPFGCEYCYQNSTDKGLHGKLDYLPYVLKRLGVFEVAIGGGEPTMHPDFPVFIKNLRQYGITPNFTTRNIKWLEEEWALNVLRLIGSYAVSVNSIKQIEKVVRSYEKLVKDVPRDERYNLAKPTIQVVMGTVEKEEFRSIVQWYKGNRYNGSVQGLTLLGYKTTGRGSDFTPIDYSWWIEIVNEIAGDGRIRIGIDTVLVDADEKALIDTGISPIFITDREGKFSCYYDAVNMKMGPSSFCDESEMVAMNIAKERDYKILSVYQQF